jgi:hypothetical protein
MRTCEYAGEARAYLRVVAGEGAVRSAMLLFQVLFKGMKGRREACRDPQESHAKHLRGVADKRAVYVDKGRPSK